MDVEEAIAELRRAGLVAVDARRTPPLVLFGGAAAEDCYGVQVFRGPFQVCEGPEPGTYLGRVSTGGQTSLEEPGDLAHVVGWIVVQRTVSGRSPA